MNKNLENEVVNEETIKDEEFKMKWWEKAINHIQAHKVGYALAFGGAVIGTIVTKMLLCGVDEDDSISITEYDNGFGVYSSDGES